IKDIIGNYKKQVKTIDKLGDKKAVSDKETVQTYIDREKELQAEREAALAKVNAKKIKVVEELKDKPTDELAKKMKDEFKL
ncbi:MAG: hypothetical protein EBZ58_09535, partial [Bacteroidetes bacterium]|nr:hypothetical protein [Bacteroidota bacterium]